MKKLDKSQIKKRLKTKKDIDLVKTIILLKRENPEAARELSKPKRRWPCINLKDIDLVEGDVIIPGKILSAGFLSEPRRIVAWAASKKAIEKIDESKSSFTSIYDEVKKNPTLNGLVMVK